MKKWSILSTLLILAGCVLAVSSVAQAGLVDGLVSYWPMDDDFTDAVGSNDGIYIGGGDPNFATGMFGNAINLDGSHYVDAGDDASLDMSADDNVSVSVWFNVDSFSSTWQALIAKGDGADYRITRNNAATHLEYVGGNGAIRDVNKPVNDGQIHHILGITSATAGTSLWLDGDLIASNSATPDIKDNGVTLGIGANTKQNLLREWNGLIDDVAIWNRPLTVDEVGEIYNGGLAGNSLGDLLIPIPEPNSALLAILGMLSFVLTARRRRRSG